MSAERRLLEVLEAGTVAHEAEAAWAARVSASLTRAVNGGLRATALAFDGASGALEALTPSEPTLEAVMAAGQASLEAPHREAVYGGPASAHTSHEIFAGCPPRALAGALADAGAADVLGLAGQTDAHGAGVSFGVLLSAARELAPVERQRLRGLATHLALARRLRRALDDHSHDVDDAPDPLRARLRAAMAELDRSRAASGKAKGAAEDGVALWQRLLTEGWVVVPVELSEAYTRLVAVRTPDASAAALRRLPAVEREVVGGVLRGLSNKEIAWRLQVSEGTVAERLRRAQQRLGVRRRAMLVRLFGGAP